MKRDPYRKMTAFLLVLVMMLSAVGCGSARNGRDESSPTGEDTTTESGKTAEITEGKETTSSMTETAETTASAEEPHETDYTVREYAFADFENTIKKTGRVEAHKNGLTMDWGASGLAFNADCEGDIYIRFAASVSTVYLTVMVDGETTLRFAAGEAEKLDITNKRIRIAFGLSRGVHTVELYRSNGPQVGRFFLRGIELGGELLAPPEDRMLIEFIGDSLSAGVGVYGKASDPAVEGVKDANEDALAAYPYLTAKALDCDISTACISGVGLVAGTIGAHYAMTKIYDLTCWHRDDAEKWSFPRAADIVVINLGTNDVGNLFNFGLSIADFKAGLRSFIATVQEKNPGCTIVWAYGLMTDGFSDYIKEAIDELNGVNGAIYFCPLPLGLSGGAAHPDATEQRAAADVLIPFLQDIIDKQKTE